MLSRNPFRRSVGFYELSVSEVERVGTDKNRSTFYTQQVGADTIISSSLPKQADTEKTRPTYLTEQVRTDTTISISQTMDSDYSPSSTALPDDSSKIVDFAFKDNHKENKKKYLTAKYGSHQMMLIKKRLNVEMWIFDELRKLYNSENDDHDCDLDLDEVLDLDSESERREYILKQVQDAKEPPEVVNKFVGELLRRAKTL